MKSLKKVAILTIISAFIISCSSTLHMYSGQQYLSDEELGTLTVAEQIQVNKFNRKDVYKTAKPPVIKALPGEHRLDVSINLNGKKAKNPDDLIQRTVMWDAVEGRVYQLVLSDSNSDVMIVDVTESSNL